MKSAMRWAVCLVMAATAVPAFAIRDDAAENPQPVADLVDVSWADASDVGGGSGEPGAATADLPATRGSTDDAIVQSRAHDAFVEGTWLPNP